MNQRDVARTSTSFKDYLVSIKTDQNRRGVKKIKR